MPKSWCAFSSRFLSTGTYVIFLSRLPKTWFLIRLQTLCITSLVRKISMMYYGLRTIVIFLLGRCGLLKWWNELGVQSLLFWWVTSSSLLSCSWWQCPCVFFHNCPPLPTCRGSSKVSPAVSLGGGGATSATERGGMLSLPLPLLDILWMPTTGNMEFPRRSITATLDYACLAHISWRKNTCHH